MKNVFDVCSSPYIMSQMNENERKYAEWNIQVFFFSFLFSIFTSHAKCMRPVLCTPNSKWVKWDKWNCRLINVEILERLTWMKNHLLCVCDWSSRNDFREIDTLDNIVYTTPSTSLSLSLRISCNLHSTRIQTRVVIADWFEQSEKNFISLVQIEFNYCIVFHATFCSSSVRVLCHSAIIQSMLHNSRVCVSDHFRGTLICWHSSV